MNLLLAATLLLASASAPNANAADVGVHGLRGVGVLDVDIADDADGAVASRRHLQNSLGDWAYCTNSSQCENQCCSNKYSTSDGRLKCTPVGGFKPSEGCVGDPAPAPAPAPAPSSTSGNLLGDWAYCTISSQCENQCCSNKYSTSDGRLKCTPVGGFKPSEGCVDGGSPPAPAPQPQPTPSSTLDASDDNVIYVAPPACYADGEKCDGMFEPCYKCCNQATFWPDHTFHQACGQMPCWGRNTRCLEGTTCNSCCNGSRWVWEWFGHHCN